MELYRENNLKLIEIFDKLDDKKDIFKEIKNFNIGNNYICYKELNEYGLAIIISEINGEKIYDIFIDESSQYGSITTFYNTKSNIGLFEKIYSNRTEYYLDSKYHSCNLDNEIINIIKENTKLILKDKKYPILYNFIKSDENIIIISKNEFI